MPLYVGGVAVLCVLCASCGMMEPVSPSLRTFAIPLPMANEDQILLIVHDATARSAEFRSFSRAFWEEFPAVYQHRCPERHCFTAPQQITLEEVSNTGRGYRLVSIAVRDGRQEPVPVGSFILERGGKKVKTCAAGSLSVAARRCRQRKTLLLSTLQ